MSRFFRIFVLICIYISIFSGISYANFSDINGHWCESMINDFHESKFVEGYGDGSFGPDNAITRAEFCKIINSYMGYNVSGDWKSANMSMASEKGYLQVGIADSTITREEAFTVLLRAMKLTEVDYDITFKDAEDIDAWASKSIKTLCFYGYVKGYESNMIKPKQDITRAEVVSVLYKYIGIGGVDEDIAETEFSVGYLEYNEYGITFVKINDELEIKMGDIITLATTVQDSEDTVITIVSGEEYAELDEETYAFEALKEGIVKLKVTSSDLKNEMSFEIKIK